MDVPIGLSRDALRESILNLPAENAEVRSARERDLHRLECGRTLTGIALIRRRMELAAQFREILAKEGSQ